jgi:hypothetical protein
MGDIDRTKFDDVRSESCNNTNLREYQQLVGKQNSAECDSNPSILMVRPECMEAHDPLDAIRKEAYLDRQEQRDAEQIQHIETQMFLNEQLKNKLKQREKHEMPLWKVKLLKELVKEARKVAKSPEFKEAVYKHQKAIVRAAMEGTEPPKYMAPDDWLLYNEIDSCRGRTILDIELDRSKIKNKR